MNTLAWLIGVIGALALTLFGFNNLSSALLGLAGIGMVLFCIGNLVFAVNDDIGVMLGGKANDDE